MNNKDIYVLAVAILVLAGAVLYTDFSEPQSGVNARDELGITLLMRAAVRGETETVRYLLKAGADIEARNKDGETAFSLWQSKHKHLTDFQEISNLLRP
ncbi:MAG: ankyrin repeat domain-containing protein [Candidatus Dadabacteria bacterium]|nr:ankyrin repeat domain-containing protein [Candidatus Dadabacteria bacterium]